MELYGVFNWEAQNQYRRENALKVYKRKKAAEDYAAKHPGNVVVRTIRASDMLESDKRKE